MAAGCGQRAVFCAPGLLRITLLRVGLRPLFAAMTVPDRLLYCGGDSFKENALFNIYFQRKYVNMFIFCLGMRLLRIRAAAVSASCWRDMHSIMLLFLSVGATCGRALFA